MSHLRKPRFQRAPEIVPIQLTERDRMIVRCVFQHRFLRSWQIAALVGGSKQAVLRRLQLLYHHGYLERPRAQIEYFQPGGSRAFAYGLADRGAELLRLTENPSPRALEWSVKNRAVKSLFLEHALLVSDVMVSLELACRRHGGIRLLNPNELPLPSATRSRLEPFRWKISLNSGTRLGVMPDCVFGLELADQPADQNRAYFFLEADRGTMPITRNGLHHSSFHRKLLAYEATWLQELHRKQFGFHRFRVLTVTTSTERLPHLVEACRQLDRGQGLFLFADLDSFRASPDPLALPWQGARSGQTVRLIDG